MSETNKPRYFSYDPDCGFDTHDTAEEARSQSEESISYYRDNACDGWSEHVEGICWGVILSEVEETENRPRHEDDGCCPECDFVVDYGLTEAQDPYAELATLRAQVAHQAEEIVRYKMAGENLCAAALIVGESADKDIAKLTAEIEWMRNQTTSGVEKIRALTLLSRQSAVNAAAELAQLTAERDALRARVAELEADLKPKAGRCELGDALCNCGGDVPAIRYSCANWRCV